MPIINDRSEGNRTTLTLSIKLILKRVALERGVSVAELIHQWIQDQLKDKSERR